MIDLQRTFIVRQYRAPAVNTLTPKLLQQRWEVRLISLILTWVLGSFVYFGWVLERVKLFCILRIFSHWLTSLLINPHFLEEEILLLSENQHPFR